MSIIVFGSINVDHVIRVAHIPRPGETTMAAGLDIYFGGKGANQAVAAGRASSDPGSVIMLGAVGEDDMAERVRRNFTRNGVAIDHLVSIPSPTGAAFIFVEESGENAISVVPAANATLSASVGPDDLLAEASHAICQMEVRPSETCDFAGRYKAINPGGHLTVNLAPVPGDIEIGQLKTLLDLTDLLVVNEIEAGETARLLGLEAATDQSETAEALAAATRTTVVLTLGSAGALAVLPDRSRIRVEPTPIEPVDTTGAGDTFVGVLVSGLREGFTLPAALDRASRAGALACRALGAQSGMPKAEELG